jgi:hypothetical protein
MKHFPTLIRDLTVVVPVYQFIPVQGLLPILSDTCGAGKLHQQKRPHLVPSSQVTYLVTPQGTNKPYSTFSAH